MFVRYLGQEANARERESLFKWWILGNKGTDKPKNKTTSTAIGMAIGFSFKDFITSVVSNILQPVIIIILSYSPVLNNYLNLSSYMSKQNKGLNIHTFISNLVSFILTIIAVYYINMYISNQV